MRVGLVSWGTEGDLRPFLALRQALMGRGHDVRLVFTGVEGKDFTSLVTSTGVPTRFADDGYFVAHREELAQRARDSLRQGNPRKQFEAILHDLMDPVIGSMVDAARALAADSDVVVGHFLAHPAAAAAEEHQKPFVMLALQPVFASSHYPPSGAFSLPRIFNRLLWMLADHVMRSALLGRVGAKPLRRPALAPKPLAARIRAVLDDPSMNTRASALAAAVGAERGAARAADLIEQG